MVIGLCHIRDQIGLVSGLNVRPVLARHSDQHVLFSRETSLYDRRSQVSTAYRISPPTTQRSLLQNEYWIPTSTALTALLQGDMGFRWEGNRPTKFHAALNGKKYRYS